MRNFNILAVMAVATLAVSACSSNDDDLAYLGSRDDIIVNNKGLPNKAAAEKITQAKIETVKVDAAKAMEDAKAVEAAVKEDVAAKEPVMVKTGEVVYASVHVNPNGVKDAASSTDAATDAPMDTTTMKGTEVVADAPTEEPTPVPVPEAGDIPPNAKPGECYAKVLIPGITETKTESVQISEEQQVLARMIPAKYEVTTEKIMVKEARQYWKRGRGPVEKIDETSGGILCLVEEPAEYKTVEKRTLITPEEPEYKTVPAEFTEVTKTIVVKADHLEWRRILCETNVTEATITRIQQALESKGFGVGKVDGRFGQKTLNALNKYQKDKGLASRGITYETLDHLGITLEGA